MLKFYSEYFNMWYSLFWELILGRKQNLVRYSKGKLVKMIFSPVGIMCKRALLATCRCSHCLSTEQHLFLHYSVIFNESKWRGFQLHPFSLLPKCICQGFLAVCACELLHHKEISLCLPFCNRCGSLLRISRCFIW